MTTELRPTCKSFQQLCHRLTQIADQGPAAVERRLGELDREWTSGRLVKATTGVLMLVGLALTAWVSPWWLILVAATGVVLLQYVFGPRSWLGETFTVCGFRSGVQIEDERIALRVLRGDFRHLPTLGHIEDRDAVARMEGEGGPAVEPDEDKYDAKAAAAMILESTVPKRAACQHTTATAA